MYIITTNWKNVSRNFTLSITVHFYIFKTKVAFTVTL